MLFENSRELENSHFFEKLTRLSKPILWISFFLGLLLSWSVLSGDSYGRVNLLYLIILYVIFPCFSLVYSLISYFYPPLQLGTISTLAVSFIQNNNFLFRKYKQQYLTLPQIETPKLALFYFSQLAAMSFSVASLLILFILLVATDVHFIWRSTLLDSEQIFDLLQLIATPWQFWIDAQPSLELISNSQDNRLLNEMVDQSYSLSNHIAPSNWWQFVLATQLFYALLMRLFVVLLLKASFKIKQINNGSSEIRSDHSIGINIHDDVKGVAVKKIAIKDNAIKDIRVKYAFNNWADISEPLSKKIKSNLSGRCGNIINAGPSATDSERLIAERWRETQLIVVKSWEPPLAELSDFMQNSKGYILPLDIKNDSIVEAKEFHLQEWLRFIEKHADWKLLVLPDLVATELVSSDLVSQDSTDEAEKNKPNAEL